jgi:FkbM family methyltransferase
MAARMPILRGRLTGKKWILGSGGKPVRVLLNSYEPAVAALFEKTLSEGDVVLDVGAHVGYYTLLSSVLVGHSGEVFAFEPNPQNVFFLKKHVEINGCHNVSVIEAAVGEESSTSFFECGVGSGKGHLSPGGQLQVRVVGLDHFVRDSGVAPRFIKIDVEGGEVGVLRGSGDLLGGPRPTLFLSTHGREIRDECLGFLRSFGYEVTPIGGGDVHNSGELLCRPA